jgi:hypothetical protein
MTLLLRLIQDILSKENKEFNSKVTRLFAFRRSPIALPPSI